MFQKKKGFGPPSKKKQFSGASTSSAPSTFEEPSNQNDTPLNFAVVSPLAPGKMPKIGAKPPGPTSKTPTTKPLIAAKISTKEAGQRGGKIGSNSFGSNSSDSESRSPSPRPGSPPNTGQDSFGLSSGRGFGPPNLKIGSQSKSGGKSIGKTGESQSKAPKESGLARLESRAKSIGGNLSPGSDLDTSDGEPMSGRRGGGKGDSGLARMGVKGATPLPKLGMEAKTTGRDRPRLPTLKQRSGAAGSTAGGNATAEKTGGKTEGKSMEKVGGKVSDNSVKTTNEKVSNDERRFSTVSAESKSKYALPPMPPPRPPRAAPSASAALPSLSAPSSPASPASPASPPNPFESPSGEVRETTRSAFGVGRRGSDAPLDVASVKNLGLRFPKPSKQAHTKKKVPQMRREASSYSDRSSDSSGADSIFDVAAKKISGGKVRPKLPFGAGRKMPSPMPNVQPFGAAGAVPLTSLSNVKPKSPDIPPTAPLAPLQAEEPARFGSLPSTRTTAASPPLINRPTLSQKIPSPPVSATATAATAAAKKRKGSSSDALLSSAESNHTSEAEIGQKRPPVSQSLQSSATPPSDSSRSTPLTTSTPPTPTMPKTTLKTTIKMTPKTTPKMTPQALNEIDFPTAFASTTVKSAKLPKPPALPKPSPAPLASAPSSPKSPPELPKSRTTEPAKAEGVMSLFSNAMGALGEGLGLGVSDSSSGSSPSSEPDKPQGLKSPGPPGPKSPPIKGTPTITLPPGGRPPLKGFPLRGPALRTPLTAPPLPASPSRVAGSGTGLARPSKLRGLKLFKESLAAKTGVDSRKLIRQVDAFLADDYDDGSLRGLASKRESITSNRVGPNAQFYQDDAEGPGKGRRKGPAGSDYTPPRLYTSAVLKAINEGQRSSQSLSGEGSQSQTRLLPQPKSKQAVWSIPSLGFGTLLQSPVGPPTADATASAEATAQLQGELAATKAEIAALRRSLVNHDTNEGGPVKTTALTAVSPSARSPDLGPPLDGGPSGKAGAKEAGEKAAGAKEGGPKDSRKGHAIDRQGRKLRASHSSDASSYGLSSVSSPSSGAIKRMLDSSTGSSLMSSDSSTGKRRGDKGRGKGRGSSSPSVGFSDSEEQEGRGRNLAGKASRAGRPLRSDGLSKIDRKKKKKEKAGRGGDKSRGDKSRSRDKKKIGGPLSFMQIETTGSGDLERSCSNCLEKDQDLAREKELRRKEAEAAARNLSDQKERAARQLEVSVGKVRESEFRAREEWMRDRREEILEQSRKIVALEAELAASKKEIEMNRNEIARLVEPSDVKRFIEIALKKGAAINRLEAVCNSISKDGVGWMPSTNYETLSFSFQALKKNSLLWFSLLRSINPKLAATRRIFSCLLAVYSRKVGGALSQLRIVTAIDSHLRPNERTPINSPFQPVTEHVRLRNVLAHLGAHTGQNLRLLPPSAPHTLVARAPSPFSSYAGLPQSHTDWDLLYEQV